MSWFEIPEPIVKLELGGVNYGLWALVTRITLQARGLWGHITGESACPPAPVPPPQPQANAAKEVVDAANKAFKDYQSALDAYKQWDVDDARAMLILLHSVEANITHLQPESAQQMWAHLKQLYQPVVDTIHYSVLQQLQTLKQNDDTVEAFFDRFMDLWCKLNSLVPLPDVCRGCACCVKRHQHDDKHCLYEFLIRLRPEFEPAKSTAPVITPAEKKNNKKKKRSGGRPNLRSSEPSEGSSSLSQNEVAQMVNQFQCLTHQGSSGSTNLPHSRNFRHQS
ncbi:uncharacterized protein [Setaria viridis]|uniref:uncharacterized protein isoform X2 n=1 Tax=Setaria viridis TaxID=4556 RepID=UPI001493B297|nr:uncharacterized protein LOC117848063 isoform X2 [Setaria viridis]